MKRHKQKVTKDVRVPVGPPSDLSPEKRISWAMGQIEAEMDSPKGLISPTGRGPSIQMVLWRAGYGKSYLEKKGEDAERDAKQTMIKSTIRTWLNSIKGRPTVEPELILTAQGDALEDEHYMRQIHDAELQLVEANARIDELETKIASFQTTDPGSPTERSQDELIEDIVLRILDRIPASQKPLKSKH